MKITLDIPDSTVEAFRLLEMINGIPWQDMLQEEISRQEFVPVNNPREVAFKAMEFCRNDQQAEAALDRAFAYGNQDGGNSVPRHGLFLSYEQGQGKIDSRERDILDEAARILESGS